MVCRKWKLVSIQKIKMKRLSVLLLLFIAVSTSAQVNQQLVAQEDTANYPYWIAMMQDQNANYYLTVSAFEKYWANRPIAKSSGYKVFKRWQYRMEHHIFADGTRMPEGYEANIIAANAANASSQQKLLVANWTELGPFGFPVNSTGQPNGIGRINEIAFHPTDPSKIYAGAPAGGFWFTNNHGTTWTTTTDVLSTLGISAIIVNKINPNTIYLGTGDRDAGDAPGLGVYRSTNAGLTWTSYSTGLGQRTVNKMVIHPADTNILLAATNGGIFRTTNAGLSWTLVSNSASFKDIVFKPDNPNIVYATEGGRFYKSINNGVSWTQSGGITGTRMAIAVTQANPNMVYVVATSGSVYGALYKSSNNGTSFTTMSTSPNIMDYSCDGSGNSGQGWYDLDIVASPTDSNTIFVGGVNIFKSTNKGSTWTISGHWTGSCGASPVHADQHVLEFNPINNRLYSGNDGGVSFSTNAGGSWADISGNMAIAQVYKIGQSVNTKNLVINGYQDNGTAVLDGTNWRTEIGGDGMECIIDYSNDNYMYGALYYGDIRR